MPLRLETLDMKVTTPSTRGPGTSIATPGMALLGALMSGPVVFMATGAWPIEMRAKDSMAATKVSNGDAYSVPSSKDSIPFKPFTAIQDELHRTYQPLKAEG